jgi:DNA repair exonuclease SbcCD nuclease subunit
MKINSKKIGLFSDIHIGLSQDSSLWHDIVIEFAKWASEKYTNLGINDIIICGDVFHNRSEISVSTLDIAKRFFDYFKDFQVYILAGNHDSFYKDHSKVNSISLLDGWNNIKIIDKEPLIIDLIDNKKASLIPWGIDYQNIPESDITFGHFEIVSFYMNTYKKCEHGLSSSNLFEKSKYIISGHFHKKDHRKYDKGDILYLGSPYQQNYGDTLDERGIYVFDLSDNTFEFIENNISPKFIKIKASDMLEENNTNNHLSLIENNHVSLTIDTNIDDDKLSILTSNIQKKAPLNFKIDYIESDSNKNIENNLEKSLEFVNILDDIEQYINSIDLTHKNETFSYIKEIYNLKTT